MVASPRYTDSPATGDIARTPAKTARESQQDENIYSVLNSKSTEENKTGDHATITLDKAARLLDISTATVKLWSDIGLLQTSMSPGKGRMVKRADILTFLPEENSFRSALKRMNNNPARAGFKRQDRKKLAEINVRAITELTKQSVYKISHLGGRPAVRVKK